MAELILTLVGLGLMISGLMGFMFSCIDNEGELESIICTFIGIILSVCRRIEKWLISDR